MKRIFDICFSFICLFLSFPLWIIIAFAIYLEDGRPAFFSDLRVGKNGKLYRHLKFRSMIKNAEQGKPMQAQEEDKRALKIGRIMRKTAMDELPQLWNILKGDMSFVGPRALRPIECEIGDNTPRSIYDFEGAKERLVVKPGLTGIAQVFAPRNVTRPEKFKYDLWYIKNQSFWLDIRIITLSFLVSFMGRWETGRDKFKHLTRYHLE